MSYLQRAICSLPCFKQQRIVLFHYLQRADVPLPYFMQKYIVPIWRDPDAPCHALYSSVVCYLQRARHPTPYFIQQCIVLFAESQTLVPMFCTAVDCAICREPDAPSLFYAAVYCAIYREPSHAMSYRAVYCVIYREPPLVMSYIAVTSAICREPDTPYPVLYSSVLCYLQRTDTPCHVL